MPLALVAETWLAAVSVAAFSRVSPAKAAPIVPVPGGWLTLATEQDALPPASVVAAQPWVVEPEPRLKLTDWPASGVRPSSVRVAARCPALPLTSAVAPL